MAVPVGAIIEAIKEKEKEGAAACARISDNFNQQMNRTAYEGSWTGRGSGSTHPQPPVNVKDNKKAEEEPKVEKDEPKAADPSKSPEQDADGAKEAKGMTEPPKVEDSPKPDSEMNIFEVAKMAQ